jgi:chromosome segregation ATPase
MQILESKQQLLDSTKQTYVSTENKVKQLKDEAMAARKELDDLKRREHTIEKECRTIHLQKEKQLQQQKTFEQTVAQSQAEFDKEIQALELELASVQQNIQDMKEKDIVKEVQGMVENQAQEREILIKDFEKVQKEIEANNQEFIQQVKQELIDLMKQLPADGEQVLESEVVNCKDDVENLIARIKSNAAVSINE